MQISMVGKTSPHWLDTHAIFIYQIGGRGAGLVNFKAGQNIMYRIIYYILKGRLPVHIVIDTDDMRQHGTKQYRRSLETGGEELSKLEPKLILTKNKISAHIDLNFPRNNI